MSSSSNCIAQHDLDRLTILAERCASLDPQTYQSSRKPTVDALWLDRVVKVFTAMAHATRAEYLEAGLPSKPIAGTSFMTVPVNMHIALAEGREGIVGLVGSGDEFVFTTLTTPFHSFVSEDGVNDPTLPRTRQLAQEFTDLRRRALRQRIVREMRVS